MWEMGYLTVLHVRLGAKIGYRHAKDSNAFRKRLMNTLNKTCCHRNPLTVSHNVANILEPK